MTPKSSAFTGKHMAAVFIGGFGVVIAVNLVMASYAVGSFHGTVVDNSYVASQHYNGWLKQATASRALGWQAVPHRRADGRVVVETIAVPARLEKVYGLMEGELSVLQVEKKIRSRVKRQMEKTQREYYLNEQMKAIQRELGETDDSRDEIMELEKRIRKTRLSKEARTKAEAEVKKLRNMSPMSAESTVVRNYLDWLLSVPWGKAKQKPIDLQKAEDILEEDHYGLEKVKERIIEYLAVQARTGSLKGPILCLVGPPGVGKTSLGRSVAKATGREFIRISLGEHRVKFGEDLILLHHVARLDVELLELAAHFRADVAVDHGADEARGLDRLEDIALLGLGFEGGGERLPAAAFLVRPEGES